MSQSSYLYVEDEPLSREVMETLLMSVVGVKSLVTFDDSHDFMDRLQTLDPPPDFILLDIHIEPLDGYEVLELIRDNSAYQSTRVIAVTASVMSKEIQQLKASGFDGAIAKPLDMLTFPDLIQRLESGETIWQVT